MVDLTTPEHRVLATLADAPFVHPLAVGTSGVLRSVPCLVAGHLRYRQPDWHWDEYLLVANDGQTIWLEYDQGFALYRPFVPASVSEITPHSTELVADGVRSRIVEREHARIAHIGGELPFRAALGDEVEYIDAHALCVEITPEELEWFRVSEITHEEVAAAFGSTPQALAERCYRLDDDGNEVSSRPGSFVVKKAVSGMLVIWMIIGLCLLSAFCCVCSGALTDQDGYDDAGTRRSYGGGHGSWGGYSGGK